MEENKNALNDDELDEVNGGLILGQNLVFKQSRSGNGNSTSTKGQPSTKASNTLFVKSKTNSSSIFALPALSAGLGSKPIGG